MNIKIAEYKLMSLTDFIDMINNFANTSGYSRNDIILTLGDWNMPLPLEAHDDKGFIVLEYKGYSVRINPNSIFSVQVDRNRIEIKF